MRRSSGCAAIRCDQALWHKEQDKIRTSVYTQRRYSLKARRLSVRDAQQYGAANRSIDRTETADIDHDDDVDRQNDREEIWSNLQLVMGDSAPPSPQRRR